MKGVIYKIENLVNGMVYVGQTVVGFETRTSAHKRALLRNEHNNDHLQRAWNKYGKDNFLFSVIEEISIDELDKKEIEWIAHHRKTTGSYNLESGGNKNKTHSSYTKAKVSKATKEAFKRPEIANKLKEAANKRRGKNNYNAREIICVTTGEIFETLYDASKKFKIDINAIYKCCKGIYKSAGKYTNGNPIQFAYYEKGKTYKEKEIKGLYERKRVVCTNTGEIFDSATKGAKKYGLSQSTVSSCCKGEIKSAGKLPNGEYSVWVYEDDYDPNNDYSFNRHKGKHNPRAKKVICLTTEEVFDTMQEAGKRYGIKTPCKISLACRGKRKHVGKLADGTKLKWSYYEVEASN
ncbi:GIY-YIG nuclease family protein [Tuberibacillus sp. Marseille-P3662]|uniref:GIY-YIG nuclease family protein n=1 Tax=Tuberibacillus sp. Marseille-P3662 TaxID=1965358 RepID=UPI000A1CEF2D|nr:GIY-YIG nuclease family protein [Tuberibacillus sp. Marseille-P3662]